MGRNTETIQLNTRFHSQIAHLTYLSSEVCKGHLSSKHILDLGVLVNSSGSLPVFDICLIFMVNIGIPYMNPMGIRVSRLYAPLEN